MAYVSTESPTLGQGPKHFGAAPQWDGLQVQSPHRYSPRSGTVPARAFVRGTDPVGIVPARGLYLCGD